MMRRATKQSKRNASPSSSVGQDLSQPETAQIKPQQTIIYENPLDLTVVLEDTQPSPDQFQMNVSPIDQAKRSMHQRTNQKLVTKLDFGAISPSSSTVITHQPQINDIKNASLYDLIKLQMINQKKLQRFQSGVQRMSTLLNGSHLQSASQKHDISTDRGSITRVRANSTQQTAKSIGQKFENKRNSAQQQQEKLSSLVSRNLKSLVLKTGRLEKSRSRSLLKNSEDLNAVFPQATIITPLRLKTTNKSSRSQQKQNQNLKNSMSSKKVQVNRESKILLKTVEKCSTVNQSPRNKETSSHQIDQFFRVAINPESQYSADQQSQAQNSQQEIQKKPSRPITSTQSSRQTSRKDQQKFASRLSQPKRTSVRQQITILNQKKQLQPPEITLAIVKTAAQKRTVVTKSLSNFHKRKQPLRSNRESPTSSKVAAKVSVSSKVSPAKLNSDIFSQDSSIGINSDKARDKPLTLSEIQTAQNENQTEFAKELLFELDVVTQEAQHCSQNQQPYADNRVPKNPPVNQTITQTPERVSRAERSRCSSERIGQIKKQKSRDGGTQAATSQKHEDIASPKRAPKIVELIRTTILRDSIKAMVKQHENMQQKPQLCQSDRASRESESSLMNLFPNSESQKQSPLRQRIPSTSLSDSNLKTPEPIRIMEDDAMFIDKDDDLIVDRQETKIKMFEVGLYSKLGDPYTERDDISDEPRPVVPQPLNFQPSPMKAISQINKHQFQSRKSIKQILSQLSTSFIVDMVRLKKPQRSSQLIGQLFCMLIWVSRESELPGAADNSPRVLFQNLEDEFASWENVQAFMSLNIPSLFQEVQTILQRFPLPKPLVDTYLRKMQHKMHVEAKTLSRAATSSSMEKVLNFVHAALDWHCSAMSSFKLTLPAPLIPSTDSEHPHFNRAKVMSVRNQSLKIVPALSSSKVKRMSRLPPPKIRSGNSVGDLCNYSSVDSTAVVRKQTSPSQLAEQSKKQLKSKYQKQQYKTLTRAASIKTLNNSSSKQIQVIASHQFKQHQNQEDVDSSNPLQDNKNASQQNLIDQRKQKLSIHKKQVSHANDDASSHSASPISLDLNSGKAIFKGTTVSSRNKLNAGGARTVTHFSRQHMQSPRSQRPQFDSLLLSSLLNRQDKEIEEDFDVDSSENLQVVREYDEGPINLVLQNGVLPSIHNGQSRNIEFQEQAETFQTVIHVTEMNEEECNLIKVCRQTPVNSVNSKGRHNFIGASGPSTPIQKSQALEAVEQKLTKVLPGAVEQVASFEMSTPQPEQAFSKTYEDEIFSPIQVYQPRKKRLIWYDADSDDSFTIQPANIGEYLEKQKQLHEGLQTQARQRSEIVPQTLDQTRQMIQELRDKHLRSSTKLPASPMSVFVVASHEVTSHEEKNDSDFEKEKEKKQQRYTANSFLQWEQVQRQNFENIVKTLGKDRSVSNLLTDEPTDIGDFDGTQKSQQIDHDA